MLYSRGKGRQVYNNSGFRNYGCLVGLVLMPLQILYIAIKKITKALREKAQAE